VACGAVPPACTGAGVPGYVPLLERYLGERGWRRPARVLLTHRHRDHIGGVADVRARFPGLPVAKMLHRDAALPEGIDDLRAALRAYMEWAVRDVMSYAPAESVVPAGRPVPRWTWSGH